MLKRVFTEMRQGHCIRQCEGEFLIVSAKGEIKGRSTDQAEATDLLLDRRKDWLEGYFAATDQQAQTFKKELAVA